MRKKFYGFFLSVALVAASFSQGVLISSAEEAENTEITTAAENVTETSEEAADEASLEEVTEEAVDEALLGEVTEEESSMEASSEQVEATAAVAEESVALQDSEEIKFVELKNVNVSISTSDELAAGKTAKFTITATNNNIFDIFVSEVIAQQYPVVEDKYIAVKLKDSDGKDITTVNSAEEYGEFWEGYTVEASSGDKITIAAGQTKTFTMDVTLPDNWQQSEEYNSWDLDIYLVACRLEDYKNTETYCIQYKTYNFTVKGITTNEPLNNIIYNLSTSDQLSPGKKVTLNFDIFNGNDFDIELGDVMLSYEDYELSSDVKIIGVDGKNISNVSNGYTSSKSDKKILVKAGEKVTYKLEFILEESFGQEDNGWFDVYGEVVNYDGINLMSSGCYKQYYYTPSENQTVEVEKKDEAAPNIKLDSAAYHTLIEAAFTDAEIASGSKLEVDVIVAVVDADAADMEKVKTVAKDGKVAIVLDLTLEAFVDGVKKGNVKVLGDTITITIDIPEEYRADDRTFTIVRLHDGIAEELVDLDNNPDTITIDTDRFSLYSLIYKGGIDKVVDAVVTPPAQNDNKTSNVASSPKTGDTAPITFVFVSMICAAFLAVVCIKKLKKQSE